MSVQKITPFLWFDDQAEDAAKFYTGIFPDSKILGVSRYGESTQEAPGRPKVGSVMTVDFELDGQRFTALNGGPQFKFSESVSFVVHCKDQKELDGYWEKLTAGGGREVACGWLKDKYGLSWQIVPEKLLDLIRDPKKSDRVMREVIHMTKLDIATLERAAA
jgi:predicted 3-demethylubiquinone-9 3-methyltransferase (glyoxalase superfamily)